MRVATDIGGTFTDLIYLDETDVDVVVELGQPDLLALVGIK